MLEAKAISWPSKKKILPYFVFYAPFVDLSYLSPSPRYHSSGSYFGLLRLMICDVVNSCHHLHLLRRHFRGNYASLQLSIPYLWNHPLRWHLCKCVCYIMIHLSQKYSSTDILPRLFSGFTTSTLLRC